MPAAEKVKSKKSIQQEADALEKPFFYGETEFGKVKCFLFRNLTNLRKERRIWWWALWSWSILCSQTTWDTSYSQQVQTKSSQY